MRFLALLALASLLYADTETARFFVQRGERALEDGKLDDAEKFVERSLGEEEGYLPALLLQARVAQRRGKKDEAIRHLEAVLAKKGSPHSDEEGRAIRAAEKLMGNLDEVRVEYDKLRAEYIAKLIELAKSSEKRKPDLAAACYRQILAVKADHAIAADKVQPPKKAPAKKRGKSLFNGKDLDGWSGKAPAWKVEDRVLVARMDRIAQINKRLDELQGDFELIYELRIIETLGSDPLVGMLFGGRGTYDHFGLWIWDDSLRLERQTEEHRRGELQRKSLRHLPGKFAREQWHTYRLVCKAKRITVYVDDKEVFSFAGADRSLDGFIGIWAQDSLVEIRSIRLVR